ncbi:helix-turn-helix domain-containing protein [Actinomadura parmotrematis]|uniref:Helix-turn-helix transcriptional regulator n=1 Tax=Actinomadura parmotrematis TaxID=2864039 RepID=A0ABS7G4X9_9ACTN|nr:helix-turn-helix transcriptional regulator [Actinomadura parmotrematis]MBW8487757.1 helix-turn-helix transcriptional regulator [Actinomadura parmotrematis]
MVFAEWKILCTAAIWEIQGDGGPLMGIKRTNDDLPDPRDSMWDFVAHYLRFERTKRGISGEALGRVLNISKSKVSRIEVGEERLTWSAAKKLDKVWETGTLFEILVWYASIGHDPQWYPQYVDKEGRAAILTKFESEVVSGLLQTEAYTRALILGGIEAADVDRLAADRLRRQEILQRQPAPFLSVIMSQNALEWPVGGPEIMREQLALLLAVSESPNVVLRIVPRTWETGAYPGLNGSFSLLSGGEFGEVAYAESPGRGRLVSAPEDVRSYVVRMKMIEAKALPESRSRDLIRKVMEECG